MAAGPKKPTVWLATLGTLVGVATGMVTLREKVLGGNDEASASTREYEREMDPICDALNATEKGRADDARRLNRTLKRATTDAAQRDAIMTSTRGTRSASSMQLSKFRAMDVPEELADLHDETAAAWQRNVDRLRRHESRLDAVEDRADLVRVIKTFSRKRFVMGRDGETRDTGLERLARGRCLDGAEEPPPVPLPPLAGPAGQQSDGGGGTSGPSGTGPATEPPADTMPDASPPPDYKDGSDTGMGGGDGTTTPDGGPAPPATDP